MFALTSVNNKHNLFNYSCVPSGIWIKTNDIVNGKYGEKSNLFRVVVSNRYLIYQHTWRVCFAPGPILGAANTEKNKI